MARNRKEATAFLVGVIKEMAPNLKEHERYEKLLNEMNDSQFHQLVEDLKAGRKYFTLEVPNMETSGISVDNNFKIADKLGVKVYRRIWMPSEGTSPAYLSPIERLVLLTPSRLMSQRINKKQSIPKDQKHTNALTGQPTGESKGASISYPELRLCVAMGLEKTMVELMKYRGGDNRGYSAFQASLMRHGRANLSTLSHFASGVESTATLKTFFTSALLKTTL